MKTFNHRRIRNLVFLAVVVALIVAIVRAEENALGASAFTTGYILLAAVFVLASYNTRKKLPFLPLGNSATWLQFHIYLGIASIFVFLLHIGSFQPNGILEGTLAVLFVLVSGSGLVGLYLTRAIPRRLAATGEEFIYERIPLFRRKLKHQARTIVLQSISDSATTTLADFYIARLFQFFECPRSLFYRVRPAGTLRRTIFRELQDLERYLSDSERPHYEGLFALVRKKDDLDFHAAMQGTLKGWLFVHIGLTYAMITVATFHGFLAHVFYGGR